MLNACFKCSHVLHSGFFSGKTGEAAEAEYAAFVKDYGTPCHGTDSVGCKDRQIAQLTAEKKQLGQLMGLLKNALDDLKYG